MAATDEAQTGRPVRSGTVVFVLQGRPGPSARPVSLTRSNALPVLGVPNSSATMIGPSAVPMVIPMTDPMTVHRIAPLTEQGIVSSKGTSLPIVPLRPAAAPAPWQGPGRHSDRIVIRTVCRVQTGQAVTQGPGEIARRKSGMAVALPVMPAVALPPGPKEPKVAGSGGLKVPDLGKSSVQTANGPNAPIGPIASPTGKTKVPEAGHAVPLAA